MNANLCHSRSAIPTRFVSTLLLLAAVLACFIGNANAHAQAESHHFNLLKNVKQFELVVPKLLSHVELQETSYMYADHTEYEIQAFGKKLHLVLEKNKDLFAPGYVELRYGANEEIVRQHTPDIQSTNCHYTGYEKSQQSSTVVAVSTCDGQGSVRGLISTQDASYYIEPAADHQHVLQDRLSAEGLDAQSAHVVYRVQDIVQPNYECGVQHDSHDGQSHGHNLQNLVNEFIPKFQQTNQDNNNNNENEDQPRSHQRSLKQVGSTVYVELMFANDVSRYKVFGANTETRSATYVNLMNTFYTNSGFNPQIKIVLVSQVTFTVSDPYTYTFTGNEVDINTLLSNFHRWRSTANIPAHDAGQLLSYMDFTNSVIGYAGVGTMCQKSNSGGIIQSNLGDLVNSMVCAHEMGHNFGMNHDSSGNTCPSSGFIMAAISCSRCSPDAVFSQCSKDAFSSWYASSTRKGCLDNIPTTSFAPRCGDGLIDVSNGEECDCGVSCAQDLCCDGATCKLRTTAPAGVNASFFPAKCSSLDPCCANCQFVPFSSQQICRSAQGFCDQSEVCSGFSSQCPGDEFKAAGTSCDDTNDSVGGGSGGQCFQGSCLSYKKQCTGLNSAFPSLSPLVPCKYQNTWGACGKLYCGANGNANSCNSFTTGGSQVMVNNGTACSSTSSSQCSAGSCVASSSLNPALSYSYQTTDWSSCVGSCNGNGGVSGTQTRVVACVSSLGNVVDATKCAGAAPAAVQSCVPSGSIGNCPPQAVYSWNAGAFTTCSSTCNGGIRTRTVVCRDQNNVVAADSLCAATAAKPATIEACNTGVACTTASWSAGAFTTCSSTCNGGTRTRTVVCRDQNNAIIPDALCAATAAKPTTIEACNTGITCSVTPQPTNLWFVTMWSSCSVTCGTGTQTRIISCRTMLGVAAPESTCSDVKPVTVQSCTPRAC